MTGIEIFCSNCNYNLGNEKIFAFYDKISQGIHLIVKIEKRNLLVDKFTLEEDKGKSKSIISSVLVCKCKEKLGKETNIGPKDEPIFCIKKEAIYFIKSVNGTKRPRQSFDKKTKWAQRLNEFPELELRNIDNFYGTDQPKQLPTVAKIKVPTNFPDPDEIFKFDIASLIYDSPRTYQIELYTAGLLENSIIYLPTGSGKTMVAAMCVAYMKKLNPNKKIFFVCDRIPLVFQQGYYLEQQCSLSVGKFCSESKESTASELKSDILVFTADFLINLLSNKTLYLGDCCLLVIDEIHHAHNSHSFTKLIQLFCDPLESEVKPRIIGLTASPSIKSANTILDGVNYLCNLINGRIYLPVQYQADFENSVYRPDMEYCIANDKSYNDSLFLELINDRVLSFFKSLNPITDKVKFENRYESFLKGFLDYKISEANVSKDLKILVVAKFLQKILNALEILNVLGSKFSVKFLIECIQQEEKNNKKSKILNEYEIGILQSLKSDIKKFQDESDKLKKLIHYLKKTESRNEKSSRILVFVKRRKTARLLCECLKSDPTIKKIWNPMEFVGHANGSLDGMQWFEEQEPTLNKFHDGICRLLVSTNVLQEGLDVTSCDKVIIFDRLTSITEYIQSRGRARNKTSQFIMIGSIDDENFYRSLVEEEKLLINVVKRIVNQLPDYKIIPRFKLISLVNLCENTDKSQKQQKHELTSITSSNTCKFTLQAYLYDTDSESQKIKSFLSKIRTLKGFVQADACNNGFLSNDIENSVIFNCLFEIRNNNKRYRVDEQKSVYEAIKYLISEYDLGFLGIIWQQKNSRSNLFGQPNFEVMCENLEFGNLKTPFEFMKSNFEEQKLLRKLTENIRFSIEYKINCFSVMAFIDNQLHKFEIDFESVENLICIHEDPKALYVYLPFKRPPYVYTTTDENISIDNLKNVDTSYLSWERRSFQQYSKDCSYKLKFSLKDKIDLINSLKLIYPNRLLFCNVENSNIDYTIERFRGDLDLKDFDSIYSIECLISQFYAILNGKIDERFAQLLNNSKENEIKYLIEMLCLKLPASRFLKFDTIMKPIYMEMLQLDEELQLEKKGLLKDLIVLNVKSCIITPSRIIFQLPTPIVSNRVLRAFNSENFICVRIRDENLEKLNKSAFSGKMTEIYANIRNILFSGIQIFNRNFQFLAMSASQLREHGCWLYASTDARDDAFSIRDWMGDFSSIRCIGKYTARLGQSLSSSIETLKANDNEFKMIQDVKVKNDEDGYEYCFTDGIGKISKSKAEEICKQIKKFSSKYISAFQIRFAGFKGVVAIDTRMSDKDSFLEFRPSMKKFESVNSKLDVINVADYIPCHLNRQIIIILTALGIKDCVFMRHQDTMLNQLNKFLIDNNTASNYILKFYKSHYSFGMSSMIDKGSLNLTFEPFFRDLLKSIYNYHLQGLIKKSRIFIEKGRILMGVIDETGVLKENEVFIQCSIDKSINSDLKFDEEIIKSKRGFIVKSKVVVAKNPCMHAGDVRVLNAVQVPELEHMLNCIVFPCKGKRPITNMCSGSDLDGDLYFASWEPSLIPGQVSKPLDYDSQPAKEKSTDIVIEDVINFFVKFIEVDQLGRIANAHVALSDSSTLGVKDPTCVELAKAFSLAVDFPKTGIVPQMPDAAKKILSYPDFMEKNLNSYESTKVIGKMYRKCKKIVLNNTFTEKIELNPCFVLDGHQKYLQNASKTYEKYRVEIERLLNTYECKTETDLLIGTLLSTNKNSNESKSHFKTSSEMVKNLWLLLREDFFLEFGLNHESYSELHANVYLKASAWYVACYSHPSNKNKTRIISFPFIVEDILSCFKNIKNLNLLSKSIIIKYFDYMNKYQLKSRFIEKIQLKKYLSDILGLNLITVGSIGLFLFEENNQSQQLIALDANDFQEIKDKLEDEEFDNITCGDSFLNCEHDNEISFSISKSKISLLRFLYLRSALFSNAFLFPIVYVIVHFARLDRLFFALLNDNVTMEMFLVFCVNYFKSKNLIKINENINFEEEIRNFQENENYENLMKLHDSISLKILNQSDIGSFLLNFYHEMAQIEEHQFACDFEKKEFKLSERVNEILKDHFENASNFVSKINDISLIWNLVLSQNRLEPHYSRRFTVSRGRGVKTQSNFMENSALLLFSNSNSELDLIEFEFYKGKRRAAHVTKHCYSAKLCSNLSQNNHFFIQACYNDYKLRSLNQFVKAKEMNSDYDYRFQVKFGNVYFTNIPSVIVEEKNSISLHRFQDAMKQGYKKYKFEFHSNKEEFKEEIDDSDEDETNEEKDDKKIEIRCRNFSDSSDDEVNREKKKKKKKKRKTIKHANSAFDSNISQSNETKLHNIFEKAEFETLIVESYIIYVEMKNKNNENIYAYRLKYDFNFELKRIETLPIKWLCVDVRNLNETKPVSYDIRFALVSQKTIEFNAPATKNAEKNQNGMNSNSCSELFEKFKQGVVKQLNEASNQKLIVHESFRNGSIFVRHSKSAKYTGNFDSWKEIFQLGGFNLNELPAHIITTNFYEEITISLFDCNEYSDNDEHGLFRCVSDHKELLISSEVDVNSLTIFELQVLIDVFWYIARAFENILE